MRLKVLGITALLGITTLGWSQNQYIYVQAYQKAIASVVGIQAVQIGNPLQGHTFQPIVGSGVIVDSQGLVITNKHVVDRTRELFVVLSNDQRFPASLISKAPDIDLALIKINQPPSDLKPMIMGNSDELQPGEIVLAIGNPAGLSKTVTHGIISAIGRYIAGQTQPAPHTYIQTDAAINPGNSGGALINLEGQLVGIPTLTILTLQNVGFAIPVNVVKTLLPQLTQTSHSIGWLGINIQEITADLRSAAPHPLPQNINGVLVNSLHPQSPAKDKIQPWDIITKIGGNAVTTKSDFQWIIRNTPPNTNLHLTVWRPPYQNFLDISLLTALEPGH